MKRDYFFIDASGNERGPVTVDTFKKYGIKSSRKVWFSGLPTWVEADSVPMLQKMVRGEDRLDVAIEAIKRQHIDIEKGVKAELIERYRPENWLFGSIVVALLCCLPAGLVGIYYATRSSKAWRLGRYAKSVYYSRIAKRWTFGGVMFILLIWIAYLSYAVVFHIAKGTVNLFNMDNYLL